MKLEVIQSSIGLPVWLKDYQWHRLDGPAYRYADGTEYWWKERHGWPDQHRDWWECER